MGASLVRYLELKVHSLVQQHDWQAIHVVGRYDRTCVVSEIEKADKMFNWQRPTAEVAGNELKINCFPGRDYVQHYALIIATYLAIKGRFRDQVFFELPPVEASSGILGRLDIAPRLDTAVVVGWGIEQLAGADGWTANDNYLWKRVVTNGGSVLYVGFLHSIWGDVAGSVVTRLAELGARRVLYVGKVGTLDESVRPNTMLASGNESLVDGIRERWSDFFHDDIKREAGVLSGLHVTSRSTLLESHDWLDLHRDYAFVDPEIGPMGRAARVAGIPFGYLHVISNNLSRSYSDDLSNERKPQIVIRRHELLERAHTIIGRQLELIASSEPRK